MTPTRRVAIIQWHIKVQRLGPQVFIYDAHATNHLHMQDVAIEDNHAAACKYIRDAASQGAELAVLPEYHLSGFTPTDPRWAIQAADSAKYLSAYQALAKELKICLVPGTIIEKEESKNIWHPERPTLASSGLDAHVAIDTPIGRVGMLICWDLAFPEAFRELIADGADIVIIPTYWTPHDASVEARAFNSDVEALFLDSTLTARCFENTCAVIFANAAGPAEDFLGLSQVTLPLVGPVVKMGNEEGVRVVDMDLGILDVAERNYKVRQDLKKEDWHYVYRHSVGK
ncbi:hypothetical protein N7526_006165 [Penicillium atrosanguineum]|nr:hypothetical protein N7526_006165 [Penicillium atrosanguineum]